MEKQDSLNKDYHPLRHFFPLLRVIVRNLWMLLITRFAHWLQQRVANLTMRYFELRDANLKDPFMTTYFPDYKDILLFEIVEETAPDSTGNSLKDKLNDVMKTKQLYKNSDLTIDDICRELATNRTYLSKAIKYTFQSGFRGFLNKFRLEKAKEIMLANNSEEQNLLEVSEQAGFRNYGTFHAAFKKEYGITPGEWKARRSEASK